MELLKAVHIILVTIVSALLFYAIVIRSLFYWFIKKRIFNNPCYVDAIVTHIKQHIPSSRGIVSIEVDYRFTAVTGVIYEKKHDLLNIKTINIDLFQPGSVIPVVYLKTDPGKNRINMPDVILDQQ